jgi:phosphoribosylglycinamide formyltransferase-1
MEFNLAILISGRGSNMLNIVEASKCKRIKSKVKLVISNNSNSDGIKTAQKLGVKTKIISKKNFH